MKYLTLVAAFLLISIAIASGSNGNSSEMKVSDLNASFIQQAYNASLGDLPDSYKSLIGDNRIAIRIKTEDNTIVPFGIVTKKGQLVEAIEGSLTKPTIEIDVTEKAIISLQQSKEATSVFNKALESGDISVKGNGFINQMKADLLLGQPILPELIAQLLTPAKTQQATA
jgi:hypothetical protein